MNVAGFLQRVYAMAAKESLHIRCDPRTLYMALGMPVVMLLLFGYGIGFDVNENPLTMVDADGGPDAAKLIRAFTANQEFVVVGTGDTTWATSLLAKNQLVATQAGALSSLLPSLILSGMMVPIENMPKPMQGISTIIPERYLVHAMRTLMLKGMGLSAVAIDILALSLFAVAVLALSTWRFKRRLA